MEEKQKKLYQDMKLTTMSSTYALSSLLLLANVLLWSLTVNSQMSFKRSIDQGGLKKLG